MPFYTRSALVVLLLVCFFNSKTFSQAVKCKPLSTVALEYDVLKTGFINEGYQSFIVDDTVLLQSDVAYTIKAEFNSYSVYKICLLADPSIDAAGFELDDNSGTPLDFTANYLEVNKNELIYDFGPEPGGEYFLKFKTVSKSGASSCAFIMVMERKYKYN